MKRLAILCSVAFVLLSGVALGAPSWKDRQQAQKLAREGQALVTQGDFKKANEKFEAADKLVPSPGHKFERATMLVELGEFLQAAAVLREAAAMKVGPADRKDLDKAVKFLAEVEERTPKLEVKMFEPPAGKARITIDGDPYDPSEGKVDFNPGDHEVVVEADGYTRWSKSVKLSEQAQETVEVTMTKGDGGGAGGSDTPEEGAEGESKGISPIPAFVCWGVGAALVGVGIGFGVAAINTTNKVLEDYDCEDGQCPSDAENDLDVAKTNGNVSTAGFAIGGAALVTGTILFFFSDMAGGGDDDEEEKEEAVEVEARPLVGPGYLGVVGRF